MVVEMSMQWNDSYQEHVLCFTNNIPQKDGGTHLTAMKTAITRTTNQYIAQNDISKKMKIETGEDMREGNYSCFIRSYPILNSLPKQKINLFRLRFDHGEEQLVKD